VGVNDPVDVLIRFPGKRKRPVVQHADPELALAHSAVRLHDEFSCDDCDAVVASGCVHMAEALAWCAWQDALRALEEWERDHERGARS